MRTPRPTFTPTPAQPTNTPTPIIAAPAAIGGPVSAAAPAGEKAIAVVNDEQVNVRSGPGIDQPILAEVTRGQQYDLVGKNAEEDWMQVCCVDGQPGWIFYAYVDVSEPADGPTAAVATEPPAAAPPPPTATPAPVVEQPPAPPPPAAEVAQPIPATETPVPTAVPAPAFPFNLVVQEQFPEGNNLVRVFLYVNQGDQALEGYTLRIKKDGAELPVSATSLAAAGFTWPVANPRQRFQNMKVEFPNVQPGGVWEIVLIDSAGNPVGPPATFTLVAADINRELYVRYEKP